MNTRTAVSAIRPGIDLNKPACAQLLGQKMAVVYARVSTSAQDVASQIEMGRQAAKELGYSEDQIIVIADAGVSARKRKIYERNGLMKVLELLKTGNIGHVIVRDRDRVARNMIEYLQIWQSIVRAKAKLYLSDLGAVPVKDNFGEEATYALMAEIEGDKIAQRTAAAGRYYPPAPFGYVKVGKKGSTRYEFTDKIDLVKDLHETFQKVSTKEEYKEFRAQWKKRIGRNTDRILQNLLYAAAIPNGDVTEKVRHIVPIAEVDTILANQKKLKGWGYGIYREKESVSPSRLMIVPCCARCGDELNERVRKGERLYFCENCSPVQATEEVIFDAVKTTIRDVLCRLNPKVIERRVLASIRSHRRDLIRTCEDKMRERAKLSLRILDNMEFRSWVA